MQQLLNQLETALLDLFKPLPALPKSAKDFLVKLAPWAALVLGILGVPVVLAALGIGTIATPWMLVAGQGLQYWLTIAVAAVTVYLNLMAYKPLKVMERKGWQLLFYGSVLGAVANLLSFNFSSLIGTLIGWYVLFQVRGEYK